MAAVLLASEGFSDIDRLVLRRLAWRLPFDADLGGLHRLQVLGVHATEPMTIGKKSCHDPVAGAIVDQGGDGDVDFLEMLAAEPRRPRAARAPAKAAKPAKVSKPKPKPDRPAEPAAAEEASRVLGCDYDMLLEEAPPRAKSTIDNRLIEFKQRFAFLLKKIPSWPGRGGRR